MTRSSTHLKSARSRPAAAAAVPAGADTTVEARCRSRRAAALSIARPRRCIRPALGKSLPSKLPEISPPGDERERHFVEGDQQYRSRRPRLRAEAHPDGRRRPPGGSSPVELHEAAANACAAAPVDHPGDWRGRLDASAGWRDPWAVVVEEFGRRIHSGVVQPRGSVRMGVPCRLIRYDDHRRRSFHPELHRGRSSGAACSRQQRATRRKRCRCAAAN